MQNRPTKRIVCLANSRKMSGRCIAGKAILQDGRPGPWIRPVSARESEEVSEYERQYRDGTDPRVLDVIDVPVLKAKPTNYQSENWLIHPDFYWQKVRSISRGELGQFVDRAMPLWIDGNSTFNGRNDRIPVEECNALDSSLRLVRVAELELVVSQPGINFGNPRRSVQGRFRHAGMDYWLRVTDPMVEREYLALPDGGHRLGESLLTVSLGEPYQGFTYKLIAAVIAG